MPAKAIAAELWYWHRTTEEIFRNSKICAAHRRQGYGPLSRSGHTSLPHHSSEPPEATTHTNWASTKLEALQGTRVSNR